MSMSGKLVGGIAVATLVLAGSQLIRDRDNPSWTSAARSISAQDGEKERASTSPVAAVPAPAAAAIPAAPGRAPAGDWERAMNAGPAESPEVRDVRIEPQRSRADVAAVTDAVPEAPITGAGALQPAAVDRLLDVGSKRSGRMRRAQPRRPSLRFAGRPNRCGSRCSARSEARSLPSRRNPIQFRQADRGSR